MQGKKGLFIVFEGVDGSGTSTQTLELAKDLQRRDKYNQVLLAHEPTWRAKEIRIRLKTDDNAFSDGLTMARLYVYDRKEHLVKDIEPNIKNRVHVVCDRYEFSTLAYQSTQGVDLKDLVRMQRDCRIPHPDITYFIDVSPMTAIARIEKDKRSREKFEENKFLEALVKTFRNLYERNSSGEKLTGEIIKINGEQEINQVAAQIREDFDLRYEAWAT